MFAWLARRLVRHPIWSTLVLLAATAAMVSGVLWIKADFTVASFFGLADPETAYLAEYDERWGTADLLMIVADGGEAGLLARDRLEQLDALAKQLEALEGVGRVMSVTRVMRVNRGPAGVFIPVPLLATAPRAAPDDARVEAWKASLLADPQVVPQYLSANGRYGTILVSLDVDTGDLQKVRPIVREVDKLLAASPIPDVAMWVGGVPAIRADVLDVIVADQVIAVPIASVLMGLMLLVLFRSAHGVMIPAVAAGIPLVMLLGFMGWTGEPFGLLNQVYLALIPAIAVADAVHLVARYHEETRVLSESGQLTNAARDEAIARTMQSMGLACFLTSFTTMVGFASLLTTHMQVLRSFGVYAAVGVGFAYITVLFIVPISLLTARSGAKRLSDGGEGVLGRGLLWVVHFVLHHTWSVVIGSALVTGAAVAAGTLVVTDWMVTDSFYEEHPVTIANRIVDGHLGGVLALEFDLNGDPGAFERPDVIAAIDAFEREVMAIEGVRATISPASILRTTARLVAGKDMLPDSEAMSGRLYGIANQAGMVSAFVDDKRDRARLIVRTADLGAVRFLELAEDLRGRIDARLEPLGVQPHLTGSTFVSSRGVHQVTGDLFGSLLSAFGVIGVIIALLFRSVRFGLLSLAPNVLPLILGYGAMGLLGWQLEPARAVVFTIAVGLSVDSAIHVLSRFSEERARGGSVDEAITASILHTGRAILITSLMLIVGFAANIFSQAPANAAFGRLGSILILSGVASNLLVLPALLKLGMGGTKVRQASVPT